MNENNKVNSEWMLKIREVVDWVINNNMYCIINVHHDGEGDNWLSKGIFAKDKFIDLWSQIADEFKNYDEHLIFESMNEVKYQINYVFDYKTLNDLTQAFVDTIRNSGGNNNYRLLIIAGASKEIELTCISDYKLPRDPANKFAISLNFYLPAQFCKEPDDNPWTWQDEYGIHEITPITTWGSEEDYNEMVSNLETIKEYFVDKGIPVIFTEVGVLTEQKKDKESIREFLNAIFSFATNLDGMMACLWDTSNKNAGLMNYYDKVNGKWFDEKIGDNFKKIGKGKYIKPLDYLYPTNLLTVRQPDEDGLFTIGIKRLKIIKVIFNAKITTNNLWEFGFGISSFDKYGGWAGEGVNGFVGVKEYDGTYTYVIDVRDKDYNDKIQIQKWWGNEFITINYLAVEFEGHHYAFDYKEYKNALSN
jgi:endoglucanase